ncbi:ISL3 family transposase [Salinicoccus albus]|uniref:ISL3 family transposase n=1 Tax=Salinicoccus albus TaxID=418756 RepID=UPI0003719EE5|nr:ISL3 family transposase [Salinicoccus albus]
MKHFILSLLQIKENNIDCTNTTVEEISHKGIKSLFITAKLTYIPTHCPDCGCMNAEYSIVKNGTRASRITLPHISGLPAFLKLTKQRYLCKDCGHSFTAETPIVEKYCHISTRTRQWIAHQCDQRLTEKYISEMASVSTTTVRRVIEETAHAIRQRPTHTLPAHLCFDEFKSVKSVDTAMSFIFCDAVSHRVIDIVEDRKQYALTRYFLRYDRSVRHKVKTVTVDMYAPYFHVIQACFPKAKIIIDKFHLVQALNRELNRTRIQVMNQYRHRDRPLYNKFKRYWKLLLKPPNHLTRTEYKKYRLFSEWKSTDSIAQYLLNVDETLNANYDYAHALSDALRQGHMEQFKALIQTSHAAPLSPGMRRVLRTFKKYAPHIEQTLHYPKLTNGPLEGINNSIKALKRVAFGYRNFAHFRDRILLMTRLYQPEIKRAPNSRKAS